MIPALLFSAPSGTGKTTFIRGLIPFFTRSGFKVGYIKHHHGKYYDNIKKKDTAVMHRSGVERTLLIAEDVVVIEDPLKDRSDSLKPYIDYYFQGYHIVIIEGFKDNQFYPKIVLVREPLNNMDKKQIKRLESNNVIAVVSNEHLVSQHPVFRFDEKEKLFKFVLNFFKLER